MPIIRRALISVSDKQGIVEFARGLADLGVEILSTGGTAAALTKAGLKVIDVAHYTGSPEILDGRLKTLHPKIHGGLLGIRENQTHAAEMKQHGIEPIDLVVVNLYPFESTVAKEDCSLAEAIEKIDIGGPTMLRAAAKNYQDVVVLVDPNDYLPLLTELSKGKGSISAERSFALAQKAFALTARYDAAIVNYLSSYENFTSRSIFPRTFAATFERVQPLRYGENPHQQAAFYRETHPSLEPSLINAEQLQGKELSYNNIMDADAALELVKSLAHYPHAAVIFKHANPCGAAISQTSLADAFIKARAADPLSAFGGIVAFNAEVDDEAGKLIGETFFEVIIAPAFSRAARAHLEKKKNLRLLAIPRLGEKCERSGWTLRKVAGGMLLQERDVSDEKVARGRVLTRRRPTSEELEALEFSWRVARHVKSNAIVLASLDQTLGIGAGQMSRVDAVELAIAKMKKNEQHHHGLLALASDAFFPFRDGVDLAAKAGVTAIVQPGGSLRDEEVIAACDEQNIAMIFTGVRHFSH